jgi:glutathione S-transferase
MADNLKVTLDLRNVSEDADAAAELVAKGGKSQVPFLVDSVRDISMYESSDIIDYLREHGNKTEEVVAGKPRVHISNTVCESCEG